MAVFDLARRSIVLKVVYYGCALGGKTTNLLTLHGLTDPEGRQRLVSIATKADRTLFFDLLPLELGQVGGLSVRVKAYTVPGQVHYEVTRRQVLSGADGVVLVYDSQPEMQNANAWARENLRRNLQHNRLDPDAMPIVLQWNKRDLPNAVPLESMQHDLNPGGLPAIAAVATSGEGVVETFEAAVKGAMRGAYATAKKKPPPGDEIDRTVERALAGARAVAPAGSRVPTPSPATFDHRFDAEAYRDAWAEKGRDRQIVDQETLLSEAVQTGMELAERLDDLHGADGLAARRERMIGALGRLAEETSDPEGPPLAAGLMGRVGSAAFRLCQGERPRLVEDLASEVFFGTVPPAAEGLVSCVVAPVACDGTAFAALVVYGASDEPPFDEAERGYWAAAARLLGLSLHWRGLRRKLARSEPAARTTT
jgi:signal recognition particle receptor subunit beta